MTFLHCVERRQKFEEGPIAVTIAGKTHKCRNRETECLQVDLRSITPYEFEALKLTYTFGNCGRREPDSSAQLCEWNACVGCEFLQYFLVDEIDSVRLKHLLTYIYIYRGYESATSSNLHRKQSFYRVFNEYRQINR